MPLQDVIMTWWTTRPRMLGSPTNSRRRRHQASHMHWCLLVAPPSQSTSKHPESKGRIITASWAHSLCKKSKKGFTLPTVNLVYLCFTVHVILTEGAGPVILYNPISQGLQDAGHQPLPLSLTRLGKKGKSRISQILASVVSPQCPRSCFPCHRRAPPGPRWWGDWWLAPRSSLRPKQTVLKHN